jgi:hypothetical protein
VQLQAYVKGREQKPDKEIKEKIIEKTYTSAAKTAK